VDEPYRVGTDVHVLPTQLPVPGVGTLPINSFVLLSQQPVLIDTGLGVDRDDFLEALRSVIDPAELAWIWLTHDDLDHSGNLQAVMELAPQAKLATHGLGALRMNTGWPVPLDRVHAIAPGDRIDLGDRTIVAVRPPHFDNPMSTGIFDDRSGTLFAVDSFGAILPRPTPELDGLSEEELVGGMVAWATFDSPWLHFTSPDHLAGLLDGVRRLAPEQILSSHLPPATGRVDAFLDVLATIPDADPFVAPDAATFAAIVAGMGPASVA
jgi:glyoxylase-like metal-dependent hydrolase (beta-lactamase superfamily II)